MTEPAIKIEGLHFSYGRKKVLKGVDLEVPKGSIFGFLGRNGSGKTTTIKTLLGLQKPQAGKCLVSGLDSVAQNLEIRQRVGFMAEDQQMYGWMTVSRIIKWVAGFYPNWDYKFADELLDILRLPKNTKIKALSKGQNSSLALLLALGHRPKIVILDDGVIVKASRTEQLRENVRRFALTPASEANFGNVPGVLDVLRLGDNVSVTLEDCDQTKRSSLKGMSVNGMTETALNLDEIFEAYVIGNRGQELS